MNRKSFLAVLLLLAILLTACGSAATSAPEFAVQEAGVAMQPEMDAAMQSPQEPAPALEEAMPASLATPAPVASSGGNGLSDILPQDAGRMVIKDALMDLLVQNVDRSVDDATELAAIQGGYLVSSRSWFVDDQKYASIRMAVPSANFERTLTFLRALGVKVISETASGQDVSADYNDLQTRLLNLEATAARVRAFLDEAKTVEESLKINATLTDLEGQINQIKGQMEFYEGRSAFSTIEVNLSPEQPTPTMTPTPTATPTPTPWSPGATIKLASNRGVGVWQSIVDGLIWICFLGWPLILVGLVIWLIVWLVKRSKRQKAATLQPAAGQNPPSGPPPAAQ